MEQNGVMDKKASTVLVAMASGHSNEFSPVQVQKMFFLLDQRAKEKIGGPHFNFRPHDYGPFDQNVYEEIEKLASKGLAAIYGSGADRRYALTAAGFTLAESQRQQFSQPIQEYIQEVAKFVQRLSFTELIASHL